MGPERRVVKEWLKTVDREELDAMLQAAIFTPDELKYIRMRLIEGMTFKEIAIDQSLTRKSVARIARRISLKRCTNREENWDTFRTFVTPFFSCKVG